MGLRGLYEFDFLRNEIPPKASDDSRLLQLKTHT